MSGERFTPPRTGERLLRILTHREDWIFLAGDSEEEFDWRTRTGGHSQALIWYWGHLLKSIPFYLYDSLYWRLTMIKNSMTIAWRNLFKHKAHSAIKILGLSLAIACCLLVYLHIRNELSYDHFHPRADSIFRIIRIGYEKDDYHVRYKDPSLQTHLSQFLPSDFPEIERQTRFAEFLGGVVKPGDEPFSEVLAMADASFFEMFAFPLVSGTPGNILSSPDSIVLTESSAHKYYGRENALGKKLTIIRGDLRKDFIVGGIAADLPKNSIFQFPFLISIENLPFFMGMPEIFRTGAQGVWPIPIFVQLKKGTSPANIESRFPALVAQHFGKDVEEARRDGWTRSEVPFSFGLQNIRDVYLSDDVYQGKGLTEALLLSGIALLIMIMACVNFTNLSIGTAAFRAKEIGVRKVVGAARRQLIRQFLQESLIMVAVAASVGIIEALLLLPTFNRLMEESYVPADLLSIPILPVLAVLLVTTAFLAGAYPAVVMAGFQPTEIIRGKFKPGTTRTFTKALVVFQFTLSVILMISAFVIQRQMKMLSGLDLGYRKEGLIAVATQENATETSRNLFSLYRDLVGRDPAVTGITACGTQFGLTPAPRADTEDIDFHWDVVDPAFMRTLGVPIVRGQDYFPDRPPDKNTVLVNESFVRAFGLGDPIGLTVGEAVARNRPGYGIPDFVKPLAIRGVVKDFHFAPLQFGIFPAAFYANPISAYGRILIRVSTNSVRRTLDVLEKRWKEIRPEKPFRYYLQDEALGRLLQNEDRWNRIVSFASALIILMACLGVFGLTQLSLSARVKEIGIRKILGAGAVRVGLETYLKIFGLLAAANVLAWPAAYFVLGKVLQYFPYRVSIGWGDFLAGATVCAGMAAFSVMALVVRAAQASPIAALRRN